MKNFAFFLFLFGFGMEVVSSQQAKEKLISRKSFENDFLNYFPNYSFEERDFYLILAYFELMKKSSNFSSPFKKFEELKIKYSHDIDILREINFFQLMITYVFNRPKEYSEVRQQHMKIYSKNNLHVENVEKIIFLFRNRYYSNNSTYCISMKKNDYNLLFKAGYNDVFIDLLYDLMCLNQELINLNSLVMAVDSSYGMSWIESLWFSLDVVETGSFENIDIFYYHLIEFLHSQGLKSEAHDLFKLMSANFPNSSLLSSAKFFFD